VRRSSSSKRVDRPRDAKDEVDTPTKKTFTILSSSNTPTKVKGEPTQETLKTDKVEPPKEEPKADLTELPKVAAPKSESKLE